ncbi:MAG: hypothetical protein DRP55_01520 [Spirochaetes bacterium]|nr:MAG: hypothetical protein DRP55_01520 [Spirochaetota bacterium]RLA89440.1 MAG: hypothetical protein DRG20_04665 [Deltaproteobacteria bacterium]
MKRFLTFNFLIIFVGLIFISSVYAQRSYPTIWWVNGNGYTGTLQYRVNYTNNKVNGTLLGTPVSGYLVGRHIVLHRYPQGKTQIWEGWIMDQTRGAPGLISYKREYFIAGEIVENGEKIYPWYALPKRALGHRPRPAIKSSIIYANQWQKHRLGLCSASIAPGKICVNSMKPGGAWLTTNRPYNFLSNYTVEFEIKLRHRDNHWLVLYSDGFLFLVIDWGTTLKHYQLGKPYNVSRPIANLKAGVWNSIRMDAYPKRRTFDLFVNGQKVSSAYNVTVPNQFYTQNQFVDCNNCIVVGDPDDITYKGGLYNRGSACWRKFKITEKLKPGI